MTFCRSTTTSNSDQQCRRLLFVIITQRCNFGCPHCINPATEQNMPFSLFRRIIDKHRESTRTVCLTGGEACLHPEFLNICFAACERGLQVHVNTNGTFLLSDHAKTLAREPITVFVSIDHTPDGIHSLRPFDSRIWRALHSAYYERKRIHVISTVSATTIENLPALARHLSDEGFLHHIQPAYIGESHVMYKQSSLWMVSPETWDMAISKMEIINSKMASCLRVWKEFYLYRRQLQTPQRCRNLDSFLIYDVNGVCMKCFSALVKNCSAPFPECFGEHCLFCWDQSETNSMIQGQHENVVDCERDQNE